MSQCLIGLLTRGDVEYYTLTERPLVIPTTDYNGLVTNPNFIPFASHHSIFIIVEALVFVKFGNSRKYSLSVLRMNESCPQARIGIEVLGCITKQTLHL